MCFYKFLAFMDLLKKRKQKSVLEVFLSGGVGGRMEWGSHLSLCSVAL